MNPLSDSSVNQVGSTLGADVRATLPTDEEVLGLVLDAAKQQLMTFAGSEDAIAQLTTVFENSANHPVIATTLQQWLDQDFSQLPHVVLLADADMNGAQGGFSAATQTIYLAKSLVQPDSLAGAVGVVIEEIGHSLDPLHPAGGDTQGDEGEWFKAVVLGTELSQPEQLRISQEDDRGTVVVDGEAIAIEQAKPIQGDDSDNRIEGTVGKDKIYGNGGNDELFGLANKDRLYGGDGDDRIDGGDGDDRIEGNAGADVIVGGDGKDHLDGGDDVDLLQGGAGRDRLYGQAGDDELQGGDDNDRLIGGDGDDRLEGGDGKDRLEGDAGADVLIGANGDDRLYGGEGADLLQGGQGRDRLYGQDGADVLQGGDDHDQLLGGNDDDVLAGGRGNDTLKGEAGNDTLNAYGGDENERDRLWGGEGADTFILGADGEVFYTKGGKKDRVIIEDLDLESDRIQLSALNDEVVSESQGYGYRLVQKKTGTEIWTEEGDRIVTLPGITDLKITDAVFSVPGVTAGERATDIGVRARNPF
ncbi:MAG: calcium-binding protein [Leptolyngbyaceae cyanobacterium]